jgi:hypothetical protein
MYESYTAEHGNVPEYPTPNIHLISREKNDKKKKKNGKNSIKKGKKKK